MAVHFLCKWVVLYPGTYFRLNCKKSAHYV